MNIKSEVVIILQQINWEQIFPVWRDKLWKGRKTEIKPTNGLKFLGGFDKKIECNNPTFFGAFVNDELVGVNSGFGTSEYSYRSRGLYVEPEHRKQGIAQFLLLAVEDQAFLEGYKSIWSMPRLTALRAYEKFGFSMVSDFFDDMEFGPNCFVVKNIK